MDLAREHSLWVIEDCAQAHDAEWRGRKAGSIGHMGCYSLMSGKHSTAGGQGGMVVTNDEDLYWQAKRFADRGKPFNSDAPGNMFVGVNYRMTELGAAIGRVQLQKLPEIVRVRRRCVQIIEETLVEQGTEGVQMGKVIEGAKSAYWFIFLRWHAERMSVDKARFCEAVGAEGVGVAANYGALAMMNPYMLDHKAYGNSDCPWCCPLWEKQGNVDYANLGARELQRRRRPRHRPGDCQGGAGVPKVEAEVGSQKSGVRSQKRRDDSELVDLDGCCDADCRGGDGRAGDTPCLAAGQRRLVGRAGGAERRGD
jgi:hypothetical protein